MALSGVLASAAPALAAAGSVLTAPIEQTPLSWGGPVMTEVDAPLAEERSAAEIALQARPAAPSARTPAPVPAPPPPPPPVPTAPMSALDAALAQMDAQTQALKEAQARRQAPSASSSPRASDQVGALVVQARRVAPAEQTVEKCVTGPAWWRVSNAKSTLWIMATADRMPMNTRFDDTCLRKRLAAARVLILPAAPPNGAQDPFSRGDTPLRPAMSPLDQRIARPLWTQLSRRIDNNAVRAADDRDWARVAAVQDLAPGVMRGLIAAGNGMRMSHLGASRPIGQMGVSQVLTNRAALGVIGSIPNQCGGFDGWDYDFSPQDVVCMQKVGGADWVDYTLYRYHPRTTLQIIRDTPNLYAPPLLVAQRLSRAFDLPGRMGNPAADRAAKLAGEANMLIGRTQISAAQFADMTYLSNPGAADQEACLKKVLDGLDAGRAGLGTLAQVQAWAVGDETTALRRMNLLSTCSFGDLSVRFWSSVVAQEMQLIDRAMAAGGTAVAIVEYDPLFMNGGVMERLKKAGYRIETPEDLR